MAVVVAFLVTVSGYSGCVGIYSTWYQYIYVSVRHGKNKQEPGIPDFTNHHPDQHHELASSSSSSSSGSSGSSGSSKTFLVVVVTGGIDMSLLL